MIFDLHSHTTCSDGVLTPQELISRAIEHQVDVLSITDHDTVDAWEVLPKADARLTLVPGVEFSTQWVSSGIHIVGLNIDPASDAMRAGVLYQTRARMDRAHRIGENLEKKGVHGAYEGALKLSVSDYVGRPHFAQFLVGTGRVKTIQEAFKKYLGAGKVGDVKQHWAEMEQVIRWIRDANGIAVLAHPMQYRFTSTRLKRLLDYFIEVGGQAMEVISGKQEAQKTAFLARLCTEKGLLASCGSDFHRPDSAWAELGSFAPLPAGLKPVWDSF
jgi:predicted metal-dependent phosphoesterase TrpH